MWYQVSYRSFDRIGQRTFDKRVDFRTLSLAEQYFEYYINTKIDSGCNASVVLVKINPKSVRILRSATTINGEWKEI